MMDINLLLLTIALILFVWVIILTILYITSVRHYKKLRLSGGEKIEDVLNTIFRGLEQVHNELSDTKGRINEVEKDILRHTQKVAFKRFNPFGDTGGDQSFSLAMLDAYDNGIVISSLHGRSGTRVYSKPVKEGAPDNYEFSEEEKDVINLAIEDRDK